MTNTRLTHRNISHSFARVTSAPARIVCNEIGSGDPDEIVTVSADIVSKENYGNVHRILDGISGIEGDSSRNIEVKFLPEGNKKVEIVNFTRGEVRQLIRDNILMNVVVLGSNGAEIVDVSVESTKTYSIQLPSQKSDAEELVGYFRDADFTVKELDGTIEVTVPSNAQNLKLFEEACSHFKVASMPVKEDVATEPETASESVEELKDRLLTANRTEVTISTRQAGEKLVSLYLSNGDTATFSLKDVEGITTTVGAKLEIVTSEEDHIIAIIHEEKVILNYQNA